MAALWTAFRRRRAVRWGTAPCAWGITAKVAATFVDVSSERALRVGPAVAMCASSGREYVPGEGAALRRPAARLSQDAGRNLCSQSRR